MHLRLGTSPITECGMSIKNPTRWDWEVDDSGWVGHLRASEVTCLECLANAGFGEPEENQS